MKMTLKLALIYSSNFFVYINELWCGIIHNEWEN